MRRIRYLVLAALGAFAALPVGRVYTSGAPWIQKIELRDNDLAGLRGMGIPGTHIDIYYRQRNFRPGVLVEPFGWCGWLNGGNALYLGSAQVSGTGTWQLQGLDTQVLPGEAAGRTCATGVLTQIELRSQYGDVSVPELHSLSIIGGETIGGGVQSRVSGSVQFADQVAAGVADGPNDVQDTIAPWTIDTDEEGTDLCVTAGCGRSVFWGYASPEVFHLRPPIIAVRDDSPLVGPRDQEFGHVMGVIQGHKSGGSILAAGYVPRPAPVGPAFDVNMNLNGGGGGELGCDAGGGYFDFFP
jgi:hypothetical protein